MQDRPWFAAKRYGYGAGVPITWEGWLALAVCVAGALAAGRYLHGLERAAAITILLAAFCLIAARKTDGGWRWRWGRD